MSKKVITAISGGVDSAVALSFLKEQGFEVEAVYFRFWQEKRGCFGCPEGGGCLSLPENRAGSVASSLGVPFSIIGLEKEFKKEVVDYFLKEHKRGRTPNPCVVCNKEMKFKVLFQELKKKKADFIATGHYVIKKRGKLFKAKDKQKDQSYFLWQLDQKILEKTLFPNGDHTKEEIKKLAKGKGLPVVDVPESQEICFIEKTLEEFLKKYLKEEPGEIVDNKGNVLGEHSGLWLYTIGQRKRIKLSGGPFYVLRKDLKRNQLIVTKNEKDLLGGEAKAGNVNWISGHSPDFPFRATAKIRYNHKEAKAKISKEDKGMRAEFLEPQRAITSGQSLVLYDKEELLGGGVII